MEEQKQELGAQCGQKKGADLLLDIKTWAEFERRTFNAKGFQAHSTKDLTWWENIIDQWVNDFYPEDTMFSENTGLTSL